MKDLLNTWMIGMRVVIHVIIYICMLVFVLLVAGAMASAINRSEYGMTIISLVVMILLAFMIPYKIGKKIKDGNKNRTLGREMQT